MRILAIESSCDETAAAVVENGITVLSTSVASSSAMHAQFGGILPELAAREQLHSIIPVLTTVLSPFAKSSEELPVDTIKREIDAVAVSVGPGLIGSLLIGVESAKTIAAVTNKPIIPVNHVLAHIYANFVMTTDDRQQTILFPAIALVCSGGHTELFFMNSERELSWLSGTIDDAAGEAFDKTARLLGFGNRGGVAIQEAARLKSEVGGQWSVKLPRPLLRDDTLDFSFSGLKTAVMREWKKVQPTSDDQRTTPNIQQLVAAFAWEIQEAITDVLVAKTIRAAEQYTAQSILVAGGVAANLRLREKFTTPLATNNRLPTTHFPPIELCTDNAVTIGSCGFFLGKKTPWETLTAIPDLSVEL